MKILFSSHRTTIPQLNNFIGTIAKELYTEVYASNALVSGPQYWIYHGMDGNMDTVFTLQIALPVQGEIQSSKFSIKELPAFKSLTHDHEGPWEKMPASYGVLLQHIEQHKIPMNDECREVYKNVDFNNPENNRVEIQLGIL